MQPWHVALMVVAGLVVASLMSTDEDDMRMPVDIANYESVRIACSKRGLKVRSFGPGIYGCDFANYKPQTQEPGL